MRIASRHVAHDGRSLPAIIAVEDRSRSRHHAVVEGAHANQKVSTPTGAHTMTAVANDENRHRAPGLVRGGRLRSLPRPSCGRTRRAQWEVAIGDTRLGSRLQLR